MSSVDPLTALNLLVQRNPRYAPFPEFKFAPIARGAGWICHGTFCGERFSVEMSGTALKKQDVKRECARKMLEWIEASREPGASTTTVPITQSTSPSTLSPTTPPQTPPQPPLSPSESPSQSSAFALHVNPISLLQEHLQAQGFPASCIRYETEDTWNRYVSQFRVRAVVQDRNGEVVHGWSRWKGNKKMAKEEAAMIAIGEREGVPSASGCEPVVSTAIIASSVANGTTSTCALPTFSTLADAVNGPAPTTPLIPAKFIPQNNTSQEDLDAKRAWEDLDEALKLANSAC